MDKTQLILVLLIFNLIFIVFACAVVIFIIEYRKKKKIHLQELEHNETIHKEDLLQTRVEIQSQTMKHIGREIHDNVGQKLTLSSLYLQQLLMDQRTSEVEENINNINEIINDSLQDLRQLSKSLTDDTLHQPITDLIEQECKKIQSLQKYQVHFEADSGIDIHSYQVKTVLLRITQEFLQNSIKHAQCKRIDVQLSKDENYIVLTLKDDGIGFKINTLKSSGIGLENMRKRTEMIQGIFILNSEIGKGTQLTLKIPNS